MRKHICTYSLTAQAPGGYVQRTCEGCRKVQHGRLPEDHGLPFSLFVYADVTWEDGPL